MSTQTKPSIVFCHVIWADGSCFSKVIPPLQAEPAGIDDRVAGLVYIAALAPDADETSQSQQNKFPVTDIFKYVEVADGRAWMRLERVVCFAGDLPEEEQKLVWATHYAPAADLFSRNAPGVAWKSKPSWYIVANHDRTVHPDLERFVAKAHGCNHSRHRQQPRPDAVPSQHGH